jgi:hypothetical protein
MSYSRKTDLGKPGNVSPFRLDIDNLKKLHKPINYFLK